MYPILLKGHSRPITKVKFNRQGDIMVTCAKDAKPQAWFVDNGERLGTFNGHQGSVWDCDIDFNSTRVITGAADRQAKLWDMKTGKCLCSFQHRSSVRSVGFSHGDRMVLTVQDESFRQDPTIYIYNLPDEFSPDGSDVISWEQSVRQINTGDHGRITRAVWGSLNETVIGACADGSIRVWDVRDGKEIARSSPNEQHKKDIKDLQLSRNRTCIITASTDYTAKIWDIRDKKLVLKKSFRSDRPLNSASMSALYNQIVVGGGQDAMDVTTTAAAAGHFEADFYHSIHEEKLGCISGHFGPINNIAFSPNGRAYVSGAEDGYVRLHHFDQSYFKQSDRHDWEIRRPRETN